MTINDFLLMSRQFLFEQPRDKVARQVYVLRGKPEHSWQPKTLPCFVKTRQRFPFGQLKKSQGRGIFLCPRFAMDWLGRSGAR